MPNIFNELLNDPQIARGLQQLTENPQQQERRQRQQLLDYKLSHQQAGSDMPSSVREWQMFESLPDNKKREYLGMKRAQQTLNLGGSQEVLNPLGGVSESYKVTPKPEQMPEFKAAQAEATAQAGLNVEKQDRLKNLKSSLPQLEETVKKLSSLGKYATYTIAGQARDAMYRQMDVEPSEGALARREYVSLVDNQILPLLRATFGAAFTAKEGESLKATLGDVDASPEEKDAVLRSFIDQKKASIGSLEREIGVPPSAPTSTPSGAPQTSDPLGIR